MTGKYINFIVDTLDGREEAAMMGEAESTLPLRERDSTEVDKLLPSFASSAFVVLIPVH